LPISGYGHQTSPDSVSLFLWRKACVR
jgi:hypothetical protein